METKLAYVSGHHRGCALHALFFFHRCTGQAPPEWLVLWGVAWEGQPIPSSTHGLSFTAPPTGKTAERTRKGRWQRAAQHELKTMLYNEWATIGALPVVKHSRTQ